LFLENIAAQCPEQGGDAVWQARAMLDWVLHTSILYSDGCINTYPPGEVRLN
jgi:hypothetical protein